MIALALWAVLLAPVAVPAEAAASGSGIAFIDDDYPGALAQARAQRKPLFVDTWASWCHTCLSMKRYVFPDPGLRPVHDAVVWLAIDGESEKNREVLDRFPLDAWPTFLMLDPRDESVIGRWIGAATVEDLRGFVQSGARALERWGKKLSTAEIETRKGDRARVRGDLAAAARAYSRAVAASGPNDPMRPERLTLLAVALAREKTQEAARRCVALGLRELDRTGDTSIATDFTATVASCAARLPKGDAEANALRERATARLDALTRKSDAPLSVDDRSDAYGNLIELLDSLDRHGEALAAAQRRLALLEKAAATAPDAAMASTFDPHRTDAYLYLGQPEKAEALLSGREKEMPEDYNPPARLARALLATSRLAEAEAAVDRALAKMGRGQRRLSVLGLKAKILAAEGKPTAEVIREQLEVLRGLPRPQRSEDLERALQRELARRP